MTFVPLNKVCLFELSLLGSYNSLILTIALLMTGTDSPVSMLSLTMHYPERSIMSQGIVQLSGTTITSPGTKESLVS